jgi:RNA binding exosome subunit
MDVAITKIEISFSVHGTEDIDKNMDAISNITEDIDLSQVQIVTEKLEGGYKNPIEYIQISFTKHNIINKILKNLSLRLQKEDKVLLETEFEHRFDYKKKTFHIRLDKESLYHNSLKITSTNNVMKLTLKMRAFTKDADFRNILFQKGIFQT